MPNRDSVPGLAARLRAARLAAGLTQVQAGSGVIFPSPGDDALVAAVLAFLADVFRRVPQGRPVQR